MAIVGIGLAARQLRERFIKNIYTCYYLRPVEQGAILRCHPNSWQVWLEKDEEYELATEVSTKPMGEDLERLMFSLTTPEADSNRPQPKKMNLLGNLQKFLKALSQ